MRLTRSFPDTEKPMPYLPEIALTDLHKANDCQTAKLCACVLTVGAIFPLSGAPNAEIATVGSARPAQEASERVSHTSGTHPLSSATVGAR